MKKKRVQPSFSFNYGVDDEERDGVAEEDSSFNDAECHIAGDEHDKSNSDEVGILFFEEDEHAI